MAWRACVAVHLGRLVTLQVRTYRRHATRGVERALAGLSRRAATIPDASQRVRYLGLREHARLLELAGGLGLSVLPDT